MKIGEKGDLLQEISKTLDRSSGNVGKEADRASRSNAARAGAQSQGDSVNVDLSLTRAFEQQVDPSLFEAERRAKVDRIAQLVHSEKYVQPTGDELAAKFVEELAFESATNNVLFGDDSDES